MRKFFGMSTPPKLFFCKTSLEAAFLWVPDNQNPHAEGQGICPTSRGSEKGQE